MIKTEEGMGTIYIAFASTSSTTYAFSNIDSPEGFAGWVEDEKNKQAIKNNIDKKMLYLHQLTKRLFL